MITRFLATSFFNFNYSLPIFERHSCFIASKRVVNNPLNNFYHYGELEEALTI